MVEMGYKNKIALCKYVSKTTTHNNRRAHTQGKRRGREREREKEWKMKRKKT